MLNLRPIVSAFGDPLDDLAFVKKNRPTFVIYICTINAEQYVSKLEDKVSTQETIVCL